ncbi:MAG: hypothetical protein H6623_00305 [Bdellovibrionaceae bacterium]|nr:hypothetical protein [Pseudobdellovibrionaceae bacterium]
MKTLLHASLLLLTGIASADTWNLLPFETNNTFRTVAGFNEIKGTTENYKIKDKDGIVDFSLVIPAMTSEELMNFDLGRVISPENDELHIASYNLQLPSNLSLPKQVESYFLSFTLDKPEFRAFIRDNGHYNLFALHGQFPMKDVINGYQNGQSLFEMINFFTFQGGGKQELDVKGPMQDVKIAVNEWSLDTQVSITAPAYAKGKEMLAFSMYQSGNEFYPVDMKRVLSGKNQKLSNRKGFDGYVLSVLVNSNQQSFLSRLQASNGDLTKALFGQTQNARASYDFSQVSYHLQPTTASMSKAQFLPEVSAPQFDHSTGKVTMDLPTATSGIAPYGTVITLSQVTPAGTEQLPLDFKRPLWSTTVTGWKGEFSLPADALAMIQKEQYAIDVLFLGSTQNVSSGAVNWDQVTHVTRNSLKF